MPPHATRSAQRHGASHPRGAALRAEVEFRQVGNPGLTELAFDRARLDPSLAPMRCCSSLALPSSPHISPPQPARPQERAMTATGNQYHAQHIHDMKRLSNESGCLFQYRRPRQTLVLPLPANPLPASHPSAATVTPVTCPPAPHPPTPSSSPQPDQVPSPPPSPASPSSPPSA